MNDVTPTTSRREPAEADTRVQDPSPASAGPPEPDESETRSGLVSRFRSAPAGARIAAGTTAAVLALLGAGLGGYVLGQTSSDPAAITPAGSTEGRQTPPGPAQPGELPGGPGGGLGQDGSAPPDGGTPPETDSGTVVPDVEDGTQPVWYVVPETASTTHAA